MTDQTLRTPLVLRDQLLSAAAAGDYEQLASLCSTHQTAIMEQFPGWTQPTPEELADTNSWETRIGGLYAVAKVFANHLGNAEPLTFLLSADQSSGIAQSERRLTESMQLLRASRYDDAIAMLSDQLIDVRSLAGHGHLHLQATTHWYLSQAHWMRLDRAKTIAHAERSLQITQRINDDPKYLTRYHRHLYEAHRYFGEPLEAARYADALVDLLAGEDEASVAVYRSQAKLMRRPGGEPPVRIVVFAGQARYELDELPNFVNQELKLAVERNRIGLQSAGVLLQQATAARDAGRMDEALGLFRQAHAADPYHPAPLMYEGYLLAHQESFFEAAERFEEAESLAPAWPGCRPCLWLCRRIAAGEYPPEMFAMLTSLDAIPREDPRRAEALKAAMEHFPDVGLVWLHEGVRLRLEKAMDAAARAFERGLTARAEPDVRTQLLVESAQLQEGPKREALLRQAIALSGNLTSAAAAKLMLNAAGR